MFNENICLWYDEAREEHDRYILECDAKEALAEYSELVLAIEQHELTDEQFEKLPDEAFPEDGELRYMDCSELNSLIDKVDNCIGVIRDILAEVINH
jgi:hypothetical protein